MRITRIFVPSTRQRIEDLLARRIDNRVDHPRTRKGRSGNHYEDTSTKRRHEKNFRHRYKVRECALRLFSINVFLIHDFSVGVTGRL
jgi:plasmid stabilization system protein ParE